MANELWDRRTALLSGTAASFGLLAWPGRAFGAPPPASLEALSFAEFLALANPLARELVGDTSPEGQDRYLLALAAVAVRLKDVPVPEMRKGQGDAGTYLGFNEGGDPFNVLHWKLDPGATIRDHPHAYGNVVTLLLEGEVRIRNYEVLGERDYDAEGDFQVRRTCDQVLRPGGVNLVSLERNYTHGFRAGPQGARGLDITTRIRERRASQVLTLGKALDDARGVFEGRWETSGGE